MIIKVTMPNGDTREHLSVKFFDGIYEVERCFYLVHESKLFRVLDVCEGETYIVTRRCDCGMLYYFTVDSALSLLDETGNANIDDRQWIINKSLED